MDISLDSVVTILALGLFYFHFQSDFNSTFNK